MLLPSMFGEDLFDGFMKGFPFYDDRDRKQTERKLSERHTSSLMRTDIKESEQAYELEMELPGFAKTDIKVSLKDGYLTVQAAKELTESKGEGDAQSGRYIRRERYAGSGERTFYVGEYVTEEDIKGEFQNGILKLTIQKKDKPAVEEKKYIAIEGE